MKENKENTKREYFNPAVRLICLIIVIIMAVISIASYARVGAANIEPIAASSIAMSISGLLLTSVLFIITLGDSKEIGRSEAFFLVTLLLLSICLFFSELGWFVEGHPAITWLLFIIEAIVSISGLIMIFTFYEYLLSTVLAAKRDALKPLTIILAVFVVVSTIVVIINPFTGLLFTVDEAGKEVFGAFKFLMAMEMLFPLWLLAFVLAYIAIYDMNRRTLESKQHDIEVADSVFGSIVPKEEEGIEISPEMQALIDAHSIPDAMRLTEMITRERIRHLAQIDHITD